MHERCWAREDAERKQELVGERLAGRGMREETTAMHGERPFMQAGPRGNQPVCFGCKLVAFGPHVGVKQPGKERQAVTPVLSL